MELNGLETVISSRQGKLTHLRRKSFTKDMNWEVMSSVVRRAEVPGEPRAERRLRMNPIDRFTPMESIDCNASIVCSDWLERPDIRHLYPSEPPQPPMGRQELTKV
jgi:hypothetical protein